MTTLVETYDGGRVQMLTELGAKGIYYQVMSDRKIIYQEFIPWKSGPRSQRRRESAAREQERVANNAWEKIKNEIPSPK